jgi:sec-independent protein translocase protein TatC
MHPLWKARRVTPDNTTSQDAPLPLLAHLAELRSRLKIIIFTLLAGFGIGYLISDTTFALLTVPLKDAFGDETGRRLIYTGLTEAFVTKMRLGLFTAFLLTFPVIATQIYLFLAPGLYKHEKGVLLPYLVAAPLLFFLGATMAYLYIFPAAWQFFLSFETGSATLGLPLQLEARMSEYLDLAMSIILAFGVSFQLPILLTLLVRMGLITLQTLQKGRRYAIVILITVAAILTPPDVISQIGLFSALYLLYELSIIACKLVRKPLAQEVEHA